MYCEGKIKNSGPSVVERDFLRLHLEASVEFSMRYNVLLLVVLCFDGLEDGIITDIIFEHFGVMDMEVLCPTFCSNSLIDSLSQASHLPPSGRLSSASRRTFVTCNVNS